MSLTTPLPPRLHECGPHPDTFRADVLAGLRRRLRRIPCKYLYDERGSQLFERICELDEYYPTRTELAIMRRHGREMAGLLGSHCALVEYGSGSSIKTRILLDHLDSPAAYIPIDISRAALVHAARALSAAYSAVEILPVCADYMADVSLPRPRRHADRTVVYFPGSTIGNFSPAEAGAFLSRAADLCGDGGGLLIGVDLKKDPALLHAAYNDSSGVTAEFNRNLLQRINCELDGNFDLDRFAHYAFYNARRNRIEMHLLSARRQAVHVAGEHFEFAAGESIFTESSYKYSLDSFQRLAHDSGFRHLFTWTDERDWFSVQYLVVDPAMAIRHG